MTTGTSTAVRRADGQVYVDAPAMERLVGAIFGRAGCDAEEAHRIAWRLTGANLRGHDSHGVLRTRRFVEWIEDGRVFPGRSIKVERETEALAVGGGDYGFGQSPCTAASPGPEIRSSTQTETTRRTRARSTARHRRDAYPTRTRARAPSIRSASTRDPDSTSSWRCSAAP